MEHTEHITRQICLDVKNWGDSKRRMKRIIDSLLHKSTALCRGHAFAESEG